MRVIVLAAFILLSGIAVGCEQVGVLQQSDNNAATARPEPPSTPGAPKEPERSSNRPSTPRPADTPAPANTPLSVMTPLAVLPSYTPEPTATAVPRPTATPISSESAQAQREEYIARCKHWALRNLEPIEYSRFEELNPYNMTDLERVLWGSVIVGQDRVNHIDSYYSDDTDYGVLRFRSDHVEWCRDYWSEPLGAENMDIRNFDALGLGCLVDLVWLGVQTEGYAKQAYQDYEDDEMSPVVVNQAVRLLNWMEIDGEALIAAEERPHDLVARVWERSSESGKGRYRESNRVGDWPRDSARSDEIEWWGIETIWRDGRIDSCRSYYPQLFFGRWIPLDDYNTEQWLEEAHEELEQAREREEWPDWADMEDRDILIRLRE